MTEQTHASTSQKPADSSPDVAKSTTSSQTNGAAGKASNSTAAKRPAGSGFSKSLSIFSILLALAAASAGGYLWYQMKIVNTQTNSELSELKRQLRALNEHPTIIELKQRIDDQDKKLASAGAAQQAEIDSLRDAFAVTQQIVNRDQRGWIIAETEYLMRLANTRLRLMLDVKGATEALITADQRLHDLGDPGALKVRETLAGEITALKTLQTPDINGAALKIISINDRLHLLPPSKQVFEKTPSPTGEDGSTANASSQDVSTWERLLSKFQIRRVSAPASTHDLYSILYFIDQRVRLELDGAKQALMRLDRGEFEKRIIQARSLLDEHYDRNNEHAIQLKAELTALLEANLFPQLPDISGSLTALIRLQQKYTPPPQAQGQGAAE